MTFVKKKLDVHTKKRLSILLLYTMINLQKLLMSGRRKLELFLWRTFFPKQTIFLPKKHTMFSITKQDALLNQSLRMTENTK